MKYIEVVNLQKYQHYQKDRPNVWIKWYFKSLNDFKFYQLTDSERWLFIGVVMLCVESGNNLPYNTLMIYHRIGFRTPKGSYRVGIGVKKMLKLGLLSSKNAITEYREEKNIEEDSSSKKLKPFYRKTGEEMRVDARGKWWVIPALGGKWLEFADKQKEIEYR